jgi:sec-independent protein translocase protein TatC
MAKQPHDDLFEKSTMSFGEHLEELRACLFRGVVGVAIGCVVGFFVANQVVRFFQSPLEEAMERYYLDKTLTDFKTEFGEPPLEVRRMAVDEGLVFERFQVETAKIAEALRLTYPEKFGGLDISPYWFTEGDLLPHGAETISQLLAEAKTEPATAANRVWQLLSEPQQKRAQALAALPRALNAREVSEVLQMLNEVAAKKDLYEAPELAAVGGPDQSAAENLTGRFLRLLGRSPPASDTIGTLRAEVAQSPSPEATRRLNKLLLARVFPASLRIARLNLLTIHAWRPVKVRFQVLNAQEAFMIWMKAGLMTGLILASPYLIYQIWTFVAAGLYPHEKHYVYLYLPISFLLFLGGASLAFGFVFRPVLDFLFTFNKGMNADFDPRIGEWLSFVLILPLGFGISFQLPLVMLFLNRIGVVSLDLYVKQWRIAILVICVVSMVLTPADPISMMLMAVPLCLLYVLGIAFCKYMPQGRNPFAEAYEP